jgi:hypothetical protein
MRSSFEVVHVSSAHQVARMCTTPDLSLVVQSKMTYIWCVSPLLISRGYTTFCWKDEVEGVELHSWQHLTDHLHLVSEGAMWPRVLFFAGNLIPGTIYFQLSSTVSDYCSLTSLDTTKQWTLIAYIASCIQHNYSGIPTYTCMRCWEKPLCVDTIIIPLFMYAEIVNNYLCTDRSYRVRRLV